MSLNHIIEAWRDEEYRESLDAETRSLLPENPAGEIELTGAELADIAGGNGGNGPQDTHLNNTCPASFSFTY